VSVKITPAIIESRIHEIRGVRVMLDSDLAELYGVTTAAINQAVERNIERFPEDFSYSLTKGELAILISQTVISSSSHGGRRKPPRVFTEHGIAMLSSVLRSPKAVKVNIEIIRAFVRLRKLLATPGELLTIVQQLSDTVGLHDVQIQQIAQVLQQMLAPPPDPAPKRKMGFQPPEKTQE